MASPQIENGYTKIANEIFDALCKIRISGEARQVFDVIIRKTYGFNKTKDKIAMSIFSDLTGIPRSHCSRAVKKLEAMNLITVDRIRNISVYSVQKDYDNWLVLPKKVTLLTVTENGNEVLPILDVGVTENGNETVTENGNNKRKKETIQKKRKKLKSLFEADSCELRLSKLLYNLILKRNPKQKKPDFQSWAENIDLMIRLDNRTEQEIEDVIRWSQGNTFWRNNILSTDKLRKQFDALYLKAKDGTGTHQVSTGASDQDLAKIVAKRFERKRQ